MSCTSCPHTEVSVRQVLMAHTLDVHIPNFMLSVAASLEMPLVTLLGRRFGLTSNHIAQLVALVALSRAVVDIPCGVLVELWGVRSMMVASVLLNVAAALVGFTATTPVALTLFCVLSGTSLGCFFLVRHVFVARVIARRYRGTYMSTISGVMRWAHVIGPMGGGLVTHYTGDIRNALVLSIVAALVATLCLIISFWMLHSQEAVTIFSPTTRKLKTLKLSEFAPHELRTPEECSTESSQEAAALPMLTSPMTSWQAPRPHFNRYCAMYGMWATLRQNAKTIFLLGTYVILFTALRANRKLMMAFAGIHAELSDAKLSFLISFGFSVDAVLFPVGGLVIDRCGRQWAMVPVALGFATVFVFLPFATSTALLFVASGLFGLADSLGCGLIMTLVADRAPQENGAPFFGIMRTLEDFGHVLGASGVGHALRLMGFRWTSWLLSASGVLTAVWGVCLIPLDTDEEDEEEEEEEEGEVGEEARRELSFQEARLIDGDDDGRGRGGGGRIGEEHTMPPLETLLPVPQQSYGTL